MEALEQWFKENGGYLHPSVHLSQNVEHGSHFQSTAAIEPGTNVLTVPHHLSMSNLNAQVDDAFPVFKSHAGSFTVEALSWFYLMGQWLNKEKSFWKPYLDTLPSPDQGYDTPLFFNDEDREWLQGTDLHPTLLAREAIWKKYWTDGVKVMKSAGMDVTGYTWDLFKWAATVYSSRSFNARTVTPQDNKYWTAYKHSPNGHETVLLEVNQSPADWKEFSVLFPVMDAGNHNPVAKVDWAYDPGQFSLTVSERVEPGSQIFNNYGPKGNEELLMGYGFCAAENPYDGVLLTMRPPPPPLQQMLRMTHPEYFKTTGEWHSEATTFRLLRNKLHETSDESITSKAWATIPTPLMELFCYVVQLERGVDVAPIEDPDEYLYRGQGSRYLPRIALYITMSLVPKIGKLEEANESLPSQPTNSHQKSAKIYRDGQYEVISSVQERLAAYLKALQPTSISSTTGPAIWTLENALQVLENEVPDAYKTFMAGVKYVTGTSKLRKLRGSEHEENLWIIFLCFACIVSASQPTDPGTGLLGKWMETLIAAYGTPLLSQDATPAAAADEEADEEAAQYLDLVKKAAMFLPGSSWTHPAWTSDFVLDWGMRIANTHGTYMDVSSGKEDEQDLRYVVYLHVD